MHQHLSYSTTWLAPHTSLLTWAAADVADQNNERENRKRICHEYQFGDKVLLEHDTLQQKMLPRHEGPYSVIRIYQNGTIKIQKGIYTQWDFCPIMRPRNLRKRMQRQGTVTAGFWWKPASFRIFRFPWPSSWFSWPWINFKSVWRPIVQNPF